MSSELFVKSDEHLKEYITNNSDKTDLTVITSLLKKYKYSKEELEYVYLIYFNKELDIDAIINTKSSVVRTDKTFKAEIKQRYSTCIITNYNTNHCEVAHIKPFSKCSILDKYNPDNGLLLSADIHKQFDSFIFSIHPETFQIILNEKTEHIETYSIYNYNKNKLDININSKSYVEYHYKEFKRLQC